jgi:hypothetical protein
MSEPRYDIYFQGDLLDGFYLDFVQADMAKLFKADPSKIEAFFSGTPQPVKLKVDKPTAAKYKMALEKIGARPIIVPMGELPAARASVPRKEAGTGSVEGGTTESVGARHTHPVNEGDWSILPPGSDIGEHREQPPVAVDTSRFSVAQVGATLVEHPNRPEPVQVDISGLTLDEPGVTLVESDRSAPPPAPDTSHLGLE